MVEPIMTAEKTMTGGAGAGPIEAQEAGEISVESHGGWFPFRFDLADDPRFKQLTSRKAVVVLEILNRVGQQLDMAEAGVQYSNGERVKPYLTEADARWGDRLGVDVQTFRDVRYEFGRDMTGRTGHSDAAGWFEYKPGHGDRNGKLYRTTYHAARFGRIRKGEGMRCALIYRHTWGFLLQNLNRKRNPLDHRDLATYVWLCFLWERYGGGRGYIGGVAKASVTIPKAEIEPMTGIRVGRFMQSVDALRGLKVPGHGFLFRAQEARPSRKWELQITNWRPFRGERSADPRRVNGECAKNVDDGGF
jgi:hypothetical protein